MPPMCTVVIPTYNRRATVVRCLEHLGRQSVGAGRLQVIVVDDGSHDDTLAALGSRSWPFADLVLIDQPNQGPGAARNLALPYATTSLTLFINDDALLHPDAVAAHLDAHRDHRSSMVLGTFAFVPDFAETPLGRLLGSTPHLFAHPLLADGDVLKADLAATCNLSVATDAAQRTGFDERFTFAAEDVDFALRLEQCGVQLRFVAAADALHDHRLTVEDLGRTARLRGVGAARLAVKHGVTDGARDELRRAVWHRDELAVALDAALADLRAGLAAHRSGPMDDACYRALADVFRLGNLQGQVDEAVSAGALDLVESVGSR